MNGRTITVSLIGLVIYAVLGGFLVSAYRDGTVATVYVAVLTLYILTLVMIHRRSSYYICPDCDKMFEIGFFRDLLSPNDGVRGKRLKCPNCGKKGWFAEYSDK
ncbi:MAG: hypothetical protein WC067_02880 [Candidatus Methanomethylophilaceae archaeon]